MKQFKGTPGPYFIRYNEFADNSTPGKYAVIQTVSEKDVGTHVCYVPTWVYPDEPQLKKEAEANARLLQHAPDLLEALQRMLSVYESYLIPDFNVSNLDVCEEARLLISKVIGEDNG